MVSGYFRGNHTRKNPFGVGQMDTPEAACFEALNVSLGYICGDGLEDFQFNLDSPIFGRWPHPDGFPTNLSPNA